MSWAGAAAARRKCLGDALADAAKEGKYEKNENIFSRVLVFFRVGRAADVQRLLDAEVHSKNCKKIS